MRKIILGFGILWLTVVAHTATPLRVMVVFAHPDEGEIYAGGISALFSGLGHQVKFLSLTNGDAGHWSMAPQALAERRLGEARQAQKILGLSEYEVWDHHDGKLKDTPALRSQVARAIEAWRADLVFLFYPIVTAPGGHPDNMSAGLITRKAAELLKMDRQPAFLYMRDYFTTGFSHIPDLAIDIDEVWETKLKACGAHVSQVVEANPHYDGVLEEVLASQEKRDEYLFYNAYPFSRVTPDIRLALSKWYSQEEAQRITWAEAFECAEFGRPLDDAAIGELLPMLGRTFTLPGNQDWLDTGIDLAAGDRLQLRSAGEVIWQKTGARAAGTADGPGALIGRIGPSAPPFFIGKELKLSARDPGRLYLGIHDDPLGDNAGFYTIWVKQIAPGH